MELVKVQAILQARAGSTRLPGKIFFRVGGLTLLEWAISRLTSSGRIERVVVATTTSPSDDWIESTPLPSRVFPFRGDEDDVLDRFHQALAKYPAKTIVRATGDNPLLDTSTLDTMIDAHLLGGFDHTGVSGALPLGLTAEVVSSSAIVAAWKESASKPHREHVTPYIYTHPEKFRLFAIPAPPAFNGKRHRLTVDTEADYRLMTEIYERLTAAGLPFNAEEAVKLLDSNPELCGMNADVTQKDWRKET